VPISRQHDVLVSQLLGPAGARRMLARIMSPVRRADSGWRSWGRRWNAATRSSGRRYLGACRPVGIV